MPDDLNKGSISRGKACPRPLETGSTCSTNPEIIVMEHAFHAAAAVSWETLERSAVRMAVVAMRPALVR